MTRWQLQQERVRRVRNARNEYYREIKQFLKDAIHGAISSFGSNATMF
jgi:hypothetical protein